MRWPTAASPGLRIPTGTPSRSRKGRRERPVSWRVGAIQGGGRPACSSGRLSCADRWRRSRRDACGGQVSEDYVFEAVGADGSLIAVRLSELLATATTRRSFLT